MNNIKIDQLIRSHRKSIGLQITKDAFLIVRAPYFASEDLIHQLIARKQSWIIKKQEYFKKRNYKISVKKFIPGEEFLFLGQSYLLVVSDDLPKAVKLENSLLISPMVLNNAREHIENWYRSEAFKLISQRVEYYAQITGLKYNSIRINNAATRWGSCGYKDTLNFTWRLIMAPLRVVDYVVVHELMHIKQKNHSRKFWHEVGNVIKDYQQDELWLKQNSHSLAWSSSEN